MGVHVFSHALKDIFLNLSEIQEIYSLDNNRSPQSVLHLYLTLFIQMLVIKISICGKLRKLTAHKVFGIFLVHHTAQYYRIVSGRTAKSQKKR